MFSLVTSLPSTASAFPVSRTLVRLLYRYYARVRLLAGVHARIALVASRTDPGLIDPGYQRGLPVLVHAVSRRANGSRTTPGSPETRVYRLLRCGLPGGSTRSAPGWGVFAAQFPARRCLYLHFTRHLAVSGARLEVKMVRYSFLVGLFHPLLHAGFIPALALPDGRGSKGELTFYRE